MNFNVPQFIEVEDKIAFQLTAKQLGWYALGGVVLFFVWHASNGSKIFFVWAVLVGIVCTFFAFVRPAGMSFFGFIIQGVRFLFKPKVMVWQRKMNKMKKAARKKKTEGKEHTINRFMKEKALKEESGDLADVLDKQSRI